MDARYEFRFWPESADRWRGRFAEAWHEAGREARSDTYLLLPDAPHMLAKLRGGDRLEIKRRLAVFPRPLEHWEMALAADPPFPDAALAAAGDQMGVDYAGAELPDALVSRFERAGAGQCVEVRKTRTLFEHGDMRGELTEVRACGADFFTVGFESPEAAPLLRIVKEWEIARHPNRDYGAFLRGTDAGG